MNQKYTPLIEKLIFYATEYSSSSAKVRSYLINKDIPYEERVPTIKTFKHLITPRSGGNNLPVIQTPKNIIIQNSSTIIESLEKNNSKISIYPITPKQKLASLLLEVYTDEWLNIPAMHFRWNYLKINYNYLLNHYGNFFKPNWPHIVQHVAAKKLFNVQRIKLAKLGINTKTIPLIERSYMNLLLKLNVFFKTNKYLLGNRPCIADFSLFGPMYAFFHKDPFAGKIMEIKAPYVNIWINRMKNKDCTEGKFFADDNVPKTLNFLLNKMALEQLPVLMQTAKILDKWNSKNSHMDLPTELGIHQYNLHGVLSNRSVFPYSLWMWQKPLYFYQSLNNDIKLKINPWLNKIGMLGALNKIPKTKLKKIDSHILISAG